MTHSNIACSQILFDRKGNVKLGPGFAHIVRTKVEANNTTLNQNSHTILSQL